MVRAWSRKRADRPRFYVCDALPIAWGLFMTDDDDTFAAACQAADKKKAQEDLGTQLNRKIEEQRRAADQAGKKINGGAKKQMEAAPLAQILDEVHAFLSRFVIYPSKEAHDAHVLWIAHTHAMDAWESTPRIAFLSPEPASGKTRAIEISELSEAPWNDLKGKQLNDRGLAYRLREYGVKSRTLNLGGENRAKGYAREDLHDAWKRYVAPPPPLPQGSVTGVTNVTEPDFQGSKVTDVTGSQRSVTDDGTEKSADESTGGTDVTDVTTVAGNRRVPSVYDAVLGERAAQGRPTNGRQTPPPLCDHCGTPGKLQPWSWPNRPDGITLHSSCEAAWFDSEGRRQ